MENSQSMNSREHGSREYGTAGARFSIVTPVYNGEATIARTIESVLSQSYAPFEYHIVDGGSQDQTVKIAESYRAVFDQKGITYVITSEPDKGIYDGMNKGIQRCTGDFVGIINADDWYEPIALETMARLHKETGFDMAYADIRMHNGDTTFIKKASNPRFVSSRTWNHPTQFTSRAIYEQKLYQNQTVFDDLDMLLWIHRHGYHIEYINVVLANFTMGGASNNEKKWSQVRKRIGLKSRIYRENGYPWIYTLDAAAIEIAKKLLGKS